MADVGSLLGALVGAVAGLAMLYFLLWLAILLPSEMARERRRDPTVWVLISIAGSPPLAILLLIALEKLRRTAFERLCCTNRMRYGLPLSPDGFSLRAL